VCNVRGTVFGGDTILSADSHAAGVQRLGRAEHLSTSRVRSDLPAGSSVMKVPPHPNRGR